MLCLSILFSYTKQQQTNNANSQYKANHFHIIFQGNRYCFSCDDPLKVEEWFLVLKRWEKKVPYKVYTEDKCNTNLLRTKHYPTVYDNSAFGSKLFYITGLGSCECDSCNSYFESELMQNLDLDVESVVFLNNAPNKEEIAESIDLYSISFSFNFLISHFFLVYPTLSLIEVVEIHFNSKFPVANQAEWLEERVEATLSFIAELGYFGTIIG